MDAPQAWMSMGGQPQWLRNIRARQLQRFVKWPARGRLIGLVAIGIDHRPHVPEEREQKGTMATDGNGANDICDNRTELRASGGEPMLQKLAESRHERTRRRVLPGLLSQVTELDWLRLDSHLDQSYPTLHVSS